MDNSNIICDEVIKSYDEEIKTIPVNFNEKKVYYKMQSFSYFTCIFVNYYSINDNC